MSTNGGHNHNHHPPPQPPPLQRQHVAVCAFPFGTHAAPLLLLVQRLAAALPDVRFSFLNTERSNAALFKAINVTAFPNIVPCAAVPEAAPPGKGNPLQAVEGFLAVAPDSFRRGMEAAEAEVGVAIGCVIGDAFLWFCGEIAKKKGVMWIPLWTAGPASLSAHFHTDVLRKKFQALQGVDGMDETADCVPGFSAVRFSDLPSGVVVGDLDSPFSQMLHKMGLMLPQATAVVINSFEELSPTITNDLKSKMRLLSVGPFPLTSPPRIESKDQFSCLLWLDKQKAQSIAYISFGTVATLPQREIVALAEALEDIGVPFIWSMSDSSKVNLPPSFLDRINNDEILGKIVPWAPQMKILSHPATGVFITHCGWNSVMESIVSAVPLICRPIIGDQMLNRQFVECEFKFGVGVEGGIFTKGGVIKALHSVLSSEEGKHMRERVKVLKKVAEEGIKPGACSDENALIELLKSARKTTLMG